MITSYNKDPYSEDNWVVELLRILGNKSEPFRRKMESEEFDKKKEKDRSDYVRQDLLSRSPEERAWIQRQNLEEAARKQAATGTPTVVPTTADKRYVTTNNGPEWQRQSPGMDQEAFVSGLRADAPYPSEGYRQEEILRRFQEMNPNLDYDAVAAQAIEKGGGNGISVPGGTFSQMPDNNFAPDHPQSDEAYMQWVKDFTYEQELARRQDPRSRMYDPESARQIIDAKIAERDAGVREIYNRAQMLQAKAAERQVEIAKEAMDAESTPVGRARALAPIIIQSVAQTDPGLARIVIQASSMLNSDDPIMQQQGLDLLASLQNGEKAQNKANETGDPQ
jgi:hypothetical protein